MASLPQAFSHRIPDDDTHARDVCDHCGFINYVNPTIIVGSVVAHEGKLLLCKRAIEPRKGLWTLPAGFMECGESIEDGAKREAQEEACADLVIEGLLAVYTVLHISQVQLMFRAHLATPSFAPGPESLEVALFDWDKIPWDQLAFPTVTLALKQWHATRDQVALIPQYQTLSRH